MPDETEKKIEVISTEGKTKTEKLLSVSEISLWLDTYDDIFSDFDPRPYSQRALSDDFLAEAKKASRERKDEALELNFLIPEKERKASIEEVIKKRLKEHFRKHIQQLRDEVRKKRINGLLFLLMGAVVSLLASFILHNGGEGFIFSLLIVLLEPFGWFSIWHGLDLIFNFGQDEKQNIEFYEKMAKAEIKFNTY